MIDKVQKIKEWISKEQDGLMDAQGNFEYPEHEGAYHILCNLDAYIDSLQEEPVSEDLEEEIKKIKKDYFPNASDPTIPLRSIWIEDIARHFANWQKEQDKETIELAEDHAMLAGMEKMKEQLLKDTVSATVITDPDAHGADYGLQKLDVKFQELESKGFKSGTKVKLIIIKED